MINHYKLYSLELRTSIAIGPHIVEDFTMAGSLQENHSCASFGLFGSILGLLGVLMTGNRIFVRHSSLIYTDIELILGKQIGTPYI